MTEIEISNWHQRQNKKAPRFFCTNCLRLFRTGRFERTEPKQYENVCPYCGAVGLTFEELAELFKEMAGEEE